MKKVHLQQKLIYMYHDIAPVCHRRTEEALKRFSQFKLKVQISIILGKPTTLH